MNVVVALLGNPTNAWRESLLLKSTFDCTYSVDTRLQYFSSSGRSTFTSLPVLVLICDILFLELKEYVFFTGRACTRIY